MFSAAVPTVSVAEVQPLTEQGWMLLDVRSDDEWASGRIPGSVHIPMEHLMERLGEIADRVVCVCAVGGRSARVTEYLNVQGRQAVNLNGGIHGWAEAGMTVETP